MRVGDNGGLQGRGISLFFDGLAPLDIVQHSGVSCCLGTERTGTLFRPLLYLFGNGCSYQIHGGVVCLRFCAKLCLAIQSAVPEVYEQIRRYHSQVQQIDHQHIGVMDIDTRLIGQEQPKQISIAVSRIPPIVFVLLCGLMSCCACERVGSLLPYPVYHGLFFLSNIFFCPIDNI